MKWVQTRSTVWLLLGVKAGKTLSSWGIIWGKLGAFLDMWPVCISSSLCLLGPCQGTTIAYRVAFLCQSLLVDSVPEARGE